MTHDKTGGPAFPSSPNNDLTYNGMTLRDWFAGQAIYAAWCSRHSGEYEGDTQVTASCAYHLADAMRSTAVYHIGENAAKSIQDKAFEAMLLAAIGFRKARKDAKRQKRAQSPEPEVIKGEFHGPCVFFTVPDWAKPGMAIRISPD